MFLYIDIVEQASTIFNLGSAFADRLIKAVKKDKSFAVARWSKKNIALLLVPLKRHVKADRIGRTRREGPLKTINSH